MDDNLNDDLINFDDYVGGGEADFNADAIFDNNLDDLIKPEEKPLNEDDFFKSPEEEVDNTIISTLLAQKGIEDISKIQIEDEEGNISEVPFSSLTPEEQLEILQYQEEGPDLEDSEIEVINFLRENNTSLEELIEFQRQKAVEEYINSTQESFTVAQFTDEELYVADLKDRFPELSEEELAQELEKELNNPDLFKKKATKLREFYTDLEVKEQENLRLQSEKEEEESYNELVNTMVEIATNTNELYDLELEDSDKEDVLQCLLAKDVNGRSEFVKMLDDPKTLFRMAWFATKGEEAFNAIQDYYKKEIDLARKEKSSAQPAKTAKVVKKGNSKGSDDLYDINKFFQNK